MTDDVPLGEAEPIPVGNYFEDFAEGETYQHHWGKTVDGAENSRFTTLRLNANPLQFNREYAQAHGHDERIVDPLLVFNTVLGLSVEDLSELDTIFLGVDNCTFHRQLEVNATITAESEVVEKQHSDSRPNYGIVTWHTSGYDADNKLVIDYQRTNMVPKREECE